MKIIKNVVFLGLLMIFAAPVFAQYELIKITVRDNADSTTTFETGVASKDTSLAFPLTSRGLQSGSRFPDSISFIIPTSEDDDSTNVINKLLLSDDGTNFYEYTAFRDTILTENGVTFKYLTNIPRALQGKFSVEARMAAADSVDVGPVEVVLEFKSH